MDASIDVGNFRQNPERRFTRSGAGNGAGPAGGAIQDDGSSREARAASLHTNGGGERIETATGFARRFSGVGWKLSRFQFPGGALNERRDHGEDRAGDRLLEALGIRPAADGGAGGRAQHVPEPAWG